MLFDRKSIFGHISETNKITDKNTMENIFYALDELLQIVQAAVILFFFLFSTYNIAVE